MALWSKKLISLLVIVVLFIVSSLQVAYTQDEHVQTRDLQASIIDDQLVNANIQLAPYIAAQSRKRQLKYIGVNLSGAEFGNSGDPLGDTYDYPTPKDAWYFIQHGINMFRIPLRWERMQPDLGSGLGPEIKYVDALVKYITANNRIAHLDIHNFGRYNGTVIGDPNNATQPGWTSIDQFANFFGMFVARYASQPLVEFTIMNEPSLMNTSLWVDIANAAVKAARGTGYKGVLYINGNRWTGCFSWFREDDLGDANSVAMLSIKDPASNLVFDCHNYFNFDNSGSDPTCLNQTVGVDRVKNITQWLQDNKLRGILGEFGAAMSPGCLSAVKYLLDYLEANSNVWLGGCWWSAGPKWGNYYASIQPLLYNSAPKNQLVQLKYYATGNYAGSL